LVSAYLTFFIIIREEIKGEKETGREKPPFLLPLKVII
jgi:hypothetical protein